MIALDRSRRLTQGLAVGVFILLAAAGTWANQRQSSDSSGGLVPANQREQTAIGGDPSVEETPSATVPTASIADAPEDSTPVEAPDVSLSDAVAVPHKVLAEDFATGATATDFLTEIATDAQQLDELLSALDLDLGGGETVDFNTSVVLYFATVQSGTCPLAPLETLAYRVDDSRIYPMTVIAPIDDPNWACTADAQARGTLVSVERSDLPKTDFSLWIDESTRTCCIDVQIVSVAGF